jgi:hypothetical protein
MMKWSLGSIANMEIRCGYNTHAELELLGPERTNFKAETEPQYAM